MWTIKKGKRVQITVKVGDVWQDGYEWKLMTKHGIDTFSTKMHAILHHDRLVRAKML